MREAVRGWTPSGALADQGSQPLDERLVVPEAGLLEKSDRGQECADEAGLSCLEQGSQGADNLQPVVFGEKTITATRIRAGSQRRPGREGGRLAPSPS